MNASTGIRIYENTDSFTAAYVDGSHRAAAELTRMGEYWYFNRLIVHNKLRGKGLATTLMRTVVTWAKDNNITIQCDVNAYGDLNIKQLMAFYEKCGFTPLFESCLYFGDKNKLPIELLELFNN